MRAPHALVVVTALALPATVRAEPDSRTPGTRTEPELRTSGTRADADLRMPPGTRTDGQGQLVSGRGVRETSDFLAKELARRGIAAQQIGPYSVRGVELTRFVSQTASTSWLAVHVLRTGGKTLIFLVPRPKTPAAP